MQDSKEKRQDKTDQLDFELKSYQWRFYPADQRKGQLFEHFTCISFGKGRLFLHWTLRVEQCSSYLGKTMLNWHSLLYCFFWRPCNRKHSDFRVAYSTWNSNGKFQISSNSLIFFSDGSSRGPGDVEVVTTKSMSASQDISSDVRSRRWVSAKEKERSQNKSAYYYAPLLDYIATE